MGRRHGLLLRPSLPIGQGELLREGTDLALVAIGVTVVPAMRAAERLAQEGISAAVINARFVKPLDRAPDHASRQTSQMSVDCGGRLPHGRLWIRGA